MGKKTEARLRQIEEAVGVSSSEVIRTAEVVGRWLYLAQRRFHRQAAAATAGADLTTTDPPAVEVVAELLKDLALLEGLQHLSRQLRQAASHFDPRFVSPKTAASADDRTASELLAVLVR